MAKRNLRYATILVIMFEKAHKPSFEPEDDVSVPEYIDRVAEQKEFVKTEAANDMAPSPESDPVEEPQEKVLPEAANSPVHKEGPPELSVVEGSNDSGEKVPERAEYLRLKKEFKAAKEIFLDAVGQDYADRNVVKKFFGLGRNKLSKEAQAAYDQFLAVNKEYYHSLETSGVLEKLKERGERSGNAEVSLEPALAGRHVMGVAEERLDRQKVQLPEGMQKTIGWFKERAQKNPKLTKAVGATVLGYGLAVNAAAVGAGLATRYLGNRFYLQGKEENLKKTTDNITENATKFDEFDLDTALDTYYSASNSAHNAKNRVRMTALGTAVAAGGLTPQEAQAGVFESVGDALESGMDKVSDWSDKITEFGREKFGGGGGTFGETMEAAKVPLEDVEELADEVGADSDDSLREDSSRVEKVREEISQRFTERNQDLMETRAQASDFAEEMGIEYDPQNSKIRTEGHVVTQINGVDVPEDLYTEEQIRNIESARSIGGATGSGLDGSVSETDVTADEVGSASEALGSVESKFESVYTIEKGDNLSSVLLDGIRARIDAGELALPDGVSRDELSSFMYRSLPEFTDASDVMSRFSEEEWVELGVKSGDPQLIQPGEEINVQKIIDEIWPNQSTSFDATDVSVDTVETNVAEAVDSDVDPVVGEEAGAEAVSATSDEPGFEAGEGITISEGEEIVTGEPAVEEVTTAEPEAAETPETAAEVPEDNTTIEGENYHVSEYLIADTKKYSLSLDFMIERHMKAMLEEGVYNHGIHLPISFISESVGVGDFAENPGDLLAYRLNEFNPDKFEVEGPTLTPEIWEALGLKLNTDYPHDGGRIVKIPENTTVLTGKLLHFIIHGDVERLKFELDLPNTYEPK